MSMFGEYLYQLIQNREISISRLSRDSGVERTAIHKALNGDRILPYPAMEALAKHLKLAPGEARRLRQYYDRLFESENVSKAREIVDRIFLKWSEILVIRRKAEGRQELLRFDDEDKKSGDWIYEFRQKNIWNGYAEIVSLIRFMISEEMKSVSPKMELALPPQALAVQECIEEIYGRNMDMQIIRLLCFDVSEPASECNLHNLEALGCVLPACILSEGKYHVYYYYNDEAQARYTDPLPYFLVTHAGAVCFSENCQTAILMKEKEQVDYFRSCFYHLQKSCYKLAEYWEGRGAAPELFGNEEQSVNEDKRLGRKRRICAIMSQPCIRKAWMPELVTLFTEKGIRDFLETGRLYDPVEGLMEIDSRKLRREMLQGFLDTLAEEKVRGRMFDKMLFTLPEEFEILLFEDCGMALHDRSKGTGLWIWEEKLCRAFWEWGNHLAKSECVFDRDRTIEIIEEMLGAHQGSGL